MAQKKIRKAYQLKVTLKSIRPPVWRRVVVPGDFCLDELHWVIQLAMGWTNSHLHQFVFKAPIKPPAPAALHRMMMSDDFTALSGPAMRGERVFTDLSTVEDVDDGEDETRFRLDLVAPTEKGKFRYDYDFGDGWQHDVLSRRSRRWTPRRRTRAASRASGAVRRRIVAGRGAMRTCSAPLPTPHMSGTRS